MSSSYSLLIKSVIDSYLDGIKDVLPPLSLVVYDILKVTNDKIDEYNLGERNSEADDSDPMKVKYPYQKQGGKKYKNITDLTPYQIAKIAVLYFDTKLICWKSLNDMDNSSIAFYSKEGLNKGLYDVSDNFIRKCLRSIKPNITRKEIDETLLCIEDLSKCVVRNENVDLIAVNNGIFDYKEKKLYDFSPDYVFLSKSKVNFNPECILSKIKMPDGEIWNIESWLRELVHDEDDYNLLWQVISATLRSTVKWERAIFLYATSGNNGKGSFCSLLRNLLGEDSYESISIEAFSKEFMLTPLMKVNNIIVDENSVTSYLENAENLKAAITADPLRVNIKNKEPITLTFKGLIVQCINSMFKVKDKSISLYRRILPIRMDKKFQGVQKPYIKNDYLKRKEVLEYVLYKALMDESYFRYTRYDKNTNIDRRYMFHMSKNSRDLLNEVKESNDPVRQFLEECMEEFKWDFLSNNFLYSCYKAWFKENVSENGRYLAKNNFIRESKEIIEEKFFDWEYTKNPIHMKRNNDTPEPFIVKYSLTNFYNKNYKGTDREKIANPIFTDERVRGFIRKSSQD